MTTSTKTALSLLLLVSFACSSRAPAERAVSTSEDPLDGYDGAPLAIIPASPSTKQSLGVEAWRLYDVEPSDGPAHFRLRGVTASGQLFTGTLSLSVDTQGKLSTLTFEQLRPQRAMASIDATTGAPRAKSAIRADAIRGFVADARAAILAQGSDCNVDGLEVLLECGATIAECLLTDGIGCAPGGVLCLAAWETYIKDGCNVSARPACNTVNCEADGITCCKGASDYCPAPCGTCLPPGKSVGIAGYSGQFDNCCNSHQASDGFCVQN